MESNSLRAANLTAHGDRLLRMGVLLFLLGLLTGFAIPALTNPRMGLTSHLEGLMNGMFLMLLGLLWPRLALSPRWLAATFWIAVYGTFANWAGTLLAAAWGTGRTTPIAAPGRSGTPIQEGVVDLLLISLSIAIVAVCGLVLWGLRSRRGAPVLLLLVCLSPPSTLRAATDPPPRPIPAGTTIRTTALFDNSVANELSPDPEQTVRWGEPSVSEMMGLWVEYVE